MDLPMSSTNCPKSNVVIWSLFLPFAFLDHCALSVSPATFPANSIFSHVEVRPVASSYCVHRHFLLCLLLNLIVDRWVDYIHKCVPPTQTTPSHRYKIRPIYKQSYATPIGGSKYTSGPHFKNVKLCRH